MERRRLTPVLAALVLVAVVVGSVVATRARAVERDRVAAAADALPAEVLSADLTIWSRVTGDLVDASLRDVTTRSVVAVLGDEMERLLGWGPADLDWEAAGATSDGAVVVLALDSVSVGEVEDGWDAVAQPAGDHTWVTSTETDASAEFRTTFARVRLLPEQRLLVAGRPDAVDAAVATVDGAPSLLDDRGVSGVVDAVGSAASVWLQSRPATCTEPGLDEAAIAQVRTVEARTGPLADPFWTARAMVDDDPRRLVLAAAFGSPQQARAQLDVRAALAEGPFIGRSGQVSDSLRDLAATVDGPVTTLDFALTPEAESFMTGTGPVVFSGCAVPSPA